MQFAEIVPNTKTDLKTQTFTYNIPPNVLPNLKIGSLVSIPFGKRKIEGIVIKIKRARGKVEKEKLKSIIKLIEPEPVLDKTHLKLAQWMSEYYLAPLSLCLFEMVALPPKRWRASEQRTAISSQQFPLSSNLYPLTSILSLCQRALAKNKQVIVLFPEVNLARLFLPYLQRKYKAEGSPLGKVIFYHGQLSKNARYQAWQKIKKGQVDVVLGSRLALFSPLSQLGLVIIVDEESEAYKNERSPRYNLKTVAEKLTEFEKAKLVLLSPTPSIGSYYHYSRRAEKRKSERVYLIRHSITPSLPRSIALVDMKKEIQKGNYGPFSENLQNILKKVIQKRGRAILFINRRGAASYILCRDCGYVLRCPNCETSLTYHLQTNRLVCHHCRFKTKPPTFCPNCRGVQIRFRGLGTQRIETEIKKMFVKPNILRIDKDLSPNTYHLSPDIVIGTQKLLSNWFKPVDLVALISIDPLLNLPDFRQGEKVFSLVFKLKSLAQKLFLIQTYHPENLVIQGALKDDYQGFYEKEIENRKKLNFPPFSKLIRLIHQDKNEERCQKEAEMVAEKLSSVVSILGPSPCFYSKIRGKYRWQIVLKVPTSHYHLSPITYRLLKTLPDDWIIDVDPISLL